MYASTDLRHAPHNTLWGMRQEHCRGTVKRKLSSQPLAFLEEQQHPYGDSGHDPQNHEITPMPTQFRHILKIHPVDQAGQIVVVHTAKDVSIGLDNIYHLDGMVV